MFFLLWFAPTVGEGRLWERFRIYSGKLFIVIKTAIRCDMSLRYDFIHANADPDIPKVYSSHWYKIS